MPAPPRPDLWPRACISVTVFFGALLILTSVSVPGTQLAVNLQSQVGQEYDAGKVTKDVHYLWSLGSFDDVKVERPAPDVLVYHVIPKPHYTLHEIWLEPNTFGIELKAPDGTIIDTYRAHLFAKQAAKQLEQRGYSNPVIREEIVPKGDGKADLHLHVTPGEDLKVKAVDFEGPDLFHDELRALSARTLLPQVGFFPGWHWLAGYSEQAAESDAGRIQSAWLQHGFLDAVVRPGDIKVDGNEVHVSMIVKPGKPSPLSPDLCRALLVERREAQKQGILDFNARYDVQTGLSVTRGPVYHVGRIDFYGNFHFGDSTLRRNMLLDEGDIFDELLLRRSVARLNKTGWFDRIDEKHVVVRPNPETGYANVEIHVTEKKPGRWNLAGPVGPMSIAGPITASIQSRLPVWATYAISISIFAFPKPILPIPNPLPRFMPVLALQRSFTPGQGWLSGFIIAPQLGWEENLISYGVNQIQGRTLPLLSGERTAQPVLPVVVNRPEGEATMFCEPPKPRFTVFRAGAGLAIHFLGVVPMI